MYGGGAHSDEANEPDIRVGNTHVSLIASARDLSKKRTHTDSRSYMRKAELPTDVLADEQRTRLGNENVGLLAPIVISLGRKKERGNLPSIDRTNFSVTSLFLLLSLSLSLWWLFRSSISQAKTVFLRRLKIQVKHLIRFVEKDKLIKLHILTVGNIISRWKRAREIFNQSPNAFISFSFAHLAAS